MLFFVLHGKYVTESRRDTSIHLFQSCRPGTREEELQDKRTTKMNTDRKWMKFRDRL